MKFKKGFTLIELLIVVAIIAILAAIAVPNFLEAQVRAKVARARTDMRSLATALESYCIDHNKYVPCPQWDIEITSYLRFCMLTTPIAYISSIFPDPFQSQVISNVYPFWDGYYGYWERSLFDVIFIPPPENRWASPPIGSPGFNEDAPFGPEGENKKWGLKSPGPDRVWNWWDLEMVTPRLVDSQHVDYDPTNGTISHGDIIRMGP